MTILTRKPPVKFEETFDEKDRAEIHNIVGNLRQSYVERLQDVTLDYNRALRQVTRTGHEMKRLEQHVQRIDQFIAKHNIPHNEEKE